MITEAKCCRRNRRTIGRLSGGANRSAERRGYRQGRRRTASSSTGSACCATRDHKDHEKYAWVLIIRNWPDAWLIISIVTRSQVLRLFTQGGLQGLFGGGEVLEAEQQDDDEDDPDYYPRGMGRRFRRNRADFPKVPSDEGRELMESGSFGTNERDDHIIRKKKLASSIMRRELGLGSPGKERSTNKLAAQGLIPSSNADTIIHYNNRCYSGQFSDDGNFFFSCAQDFRVRMYDTSNPYNWRYYRTATYPNGQWTITDASLSPDNKFLAYSSIRSMVCLAGTDPNEPSEPHFLEFSDTSRSASHWGRGHFGVSFS